MSSEDYVEISIDVFQAGGQRARVKRSLSIARLQEEILKEFDDLDRSDPEKYAVFLAGTEKPLPRGATLAKLDIQTHDELEFRYLRRSGRRPLNSPAPFALRDDMGGLYELQWQPALIGRPSNDPDHNELLAVNLQSHRFGGQISRRHAQIVYEDGKFHLEPLSDSNPIFLNNEASPISGRRELHEGDRIYLSKMRVVLVFGPGRAETPAPVERVPVERAAVERAPAERAPAQPRPAPAAPRGPARLRLVFARADGTAEIVESAETPFFLGREGCNYTVDDSTVSRRHARIDYDLASGGYTITDMNSVNGVKINGDLIPKNTAVPLPPGCSVSLGQKTHFVFERV